MIDPLVAEEAWLDALAGVREWIPPAQQTVVIAPHPDDETLGAGGLIARLREAGCEVSVIAVTDGENCYAGEHFGDVRTKEQTCALARLSVDEERIQRLHLPDSGLGGCEAAVEEAFHTLIPERSQVIAPWSNDFHPDHEVCGRAAAKVAKAKSLDLIFYPFWAWHRGSLDVFEPRLLVKLPLTANQQIAKREALSCHRSQLVHASGEPILPENLLVPARRAFEVFITA